ncbi:unnamed protein product [Mytilus coruscus]|uniref:Uncharacterized protein n=1 Tax=Mytilus coruscus TaxID=42192 RepID=A0A6J8D683_MYTCO|nr:unnamed protein product [Mytilus coruscus]
MHTIDESECSDNEDETIPMKLVTPRRSTTNQKAKKIGNKTSSPSFGVISTLRRIEGLLLSAAEDVSNLNDTVNCHIDTTNKQFQEINDKFVSLANTAKVQTSSASASVEEVLAQTHIIISDINSNNKTFVDKSKSLWDKVNAVFQEVKSIKTSNENIAMQDKVAQICTPNSKREEKNLTTTKMTPGKYSNAVKSGLQCRIRQSSTPNTPGSFLRQRCEQIPNVEYHERELERPKFPLFQRNNDKKNLFLIGSSTLKRMSARKMTTDNIQFIL